MSSYKKLFNNTLVYFIGTLSSKFISFLLVPLYTYYLSTAEYGTIDLITVTSTMIMPILTFSIFEAVLRFSIDKTGDKDSVIKNAIIMFALGYVIFVLISPLLVFFGFQRDILIYLYLFVLTEGLLTILGQYTRGIGNSRAFAINGVIRTLFSGLLSILFIVFIGMGIQGYMLAYIIADLIAIIHLVYVTDLFARLRRGKRDLNLSKSMLKYSLPLIPNSILWSLITSSSKYIINGFLGVNANGIYAVSSRIPTLVNMVSQVFTQAWQLTIMEEYDEGKDTKDFYSNIFRVYSVTLFMVTSIILVVLKPAFSILFSQNYYEAWEPVPFLLLGSVFSAFSAFIGAAYTASKKTSGTLKTSIYGGVMSVILNLILIPSIGLIGAGISSMISYFVMFIIRYFDTRKYFTVNINWINFVTNLILVLIMSLVLLLNLSIGLEISILIFVFLVLLILNYKTIRNIWDLALNLLKSLRVKDADR